MVQSSRDIVAASHFATRLRGFRDRDLGAGMQALAGHRRSRENGSRQHENVIELHDGLEMKVPNRVC